MGSQRTLRAWSLLVAGYVGSVGVTSMTKGSYFGSRRVTENGTVVLVLHRGALPRLDPAVVFSDDSNGPATQTLTPQKRWW